MYAKKMCMYISIRLINADGRLEPTDIMIIRKKLKEVINMTDV